MSLSFPNFAPAPSESPSPGAAGLSPMQTGRTPNDAGDDQDGMQADFQSVLSSESSPAPQVQESSGTAGRKGAATPAQTSASSSTSALGVDNGAAPKPSAPSESYWSPLLAHSAGLAKVADKKGPAPSSANASESTPASAQPVLAVATAQQVPSVPAAGDSVGAKTPSPPGGTSRVALASEDQGMQIPSGESAAAAAAGVSDATSLKAAMAEGGLAQAGIAQQTYGPAGRMGAEKSAAFESTAPAAPKLATSAANKNSVNVAIESVTDNLRGIGTSVAMPSATMPSATQTLPPTLAPAGVLPGFSAGGSERATTGAPAQSPATQAVENALQVSDLQAAVSQATQSSVNLKFNVSGEDLSVRVALQGGQVHTQFSTDSNELRTAIAHEWQTVGASSGSTRLAEPVFTSQSRGDSKQEMGLGGDGGQQAGQRREWSSGEADGQALSLTATTAQAASEGSPAPEPIHVPTTGASNRLRSFA
jgi:hypothetical protein